MGPVGQDRQHDRGIDVIFDTSTSGQFETVKCADKTLHTGPRLAKQQRKTQHSRNSSARNALLPGLWTLTE